MALLSYSISKTEDRRTKWIVFAVALPHLLLITPILFWTTESEWNKPNASWFGAAGAWTLATFLISLFYLFLSGLLAHVVCGKTVIHISDAGVNRRRELFGWAWKETVYPASVIESWSWSIQFPWHRGLQPIVKRALAVYECRLLIREGSRQRMGTLLTSRNSGDIARLCEALERQWPNRSTQQPLTSEYLESYWATTPESR